MTAQKIHYTTRSNKGESRYLCGFYLREPKANTMTGDKKKVTCKRCLEFFKASGKNDAKTTWCKQNKKRDWQW